MLPIRNISYLLPMCCSFWEKCMNSPKTGLGCSTPLKTSLLHLMTPGDLKISDNSIWSKMDISTLCAKLFIYGVHFVDSTTLKVDMPILTCIFFTFNWLTLTSEMHFVKFHPEVASCLLSRGKRKYAPLGMRLLWKYIRNYFLVYQLISRFLLYLQNYKEFEAEILDLQSEKYGLSFDIKNILLPVEPWGMRMWSA